MPHGAFKHSGYGKDLSGYGFEDYTRIKHVMSDIGEWGWPRELRGPERHWGSRGVALPAGRVPLAGGPPAMP
jgi:hypothetical protein